MSTSRCGFFIAVPAVALNISPSRTRVLFFYLMPFALPGQPEYRTIMVIASLQVVAVPRLDKSLDRIRHCHTLRLAYLNWWASADITI